MSAADVVLPSGRQFEIALGDQRVVVVEVGGGLRSYAVGGADVLDGYEVGGACTSGRGQVLIPWPNRIGQGSYEFGGREYLRCPWTRCRIETRSTGSSAGRPGRPRSMSRTGW
jgi:aldose 1-epimerase